MSFQSPNQQCQSTERKAQEDIFYQTRLVKITRKHSCHENFPILLTEWDQISHCMLHSEYHTSRIIYITITVMLSKTDNIHLLQFEQQLQNCNIWKVFFSKHVFIFDIKYANIVNTYESNEQNCMTNKTAIKTWLYITEFLSKHHLNCIVCYSERERFYWSAGWCI